MKFLNIFVHTLSRSCVDLAAKIRNKIHSKKIRLWVSSEELNTCVDTKLKSIIANWRDRRDIESYLKIDHSIGYYEWDLSKTGVESVASVGLQALISRRDNCDEEFIIISDAPKCKNKAVYFTDAKHKEELPSRWYKYSWFTKIEEIHALCKNLGVCDFDLKLKDKNQYVSIGIPGHVHPAYKELSTGRIIYLDTFHKDHYECFSRTGKHLGEMTLNGDLEPNTGDPRKDFKL